MVQKKKHSFIRKAKDISINGTLALLLLSQGGVWQSCTSNRSEEADYEIAENYTTGVRTYIQEESPGKFKITDEISVPSDSTQAIVTYLDGRKETLSREQSKNLIDKEVKHNEASIGHNNGLANVLLYGGMGYFLGRTLSPGYTAYRPDIHRKEEEGRSASRYHNRGRYYANESSFQKSAQVQESVSRSRTMTTRPRSGRSGFFGGSRRGSFLG